MARPRARWRLHDVDRSGTPYLPEASLLGSALMAAALALACGWLVNRFAVRSIDLGALSVAAAFAGALSQEPVQRSLGGGRLDNRPALRSALTFAGVAVPLDIAHIGFLLPLTNVLIGAIFIHWCGSRAARPVAVTAVAVCMINFAAMVAGLHTSLLSTALDAQITVGAQALALGGVANLGLMAARQELVTTRLAQAEARFRALVQNASDVVMVARTDGVLDWVSPASTAVLGLRPEVLTGSPLADLVDDGFAGSFAERWAEVTSTDDGGRARPTVRWEARLRRGWGTAGWLEFSATDQRSDPSIGGVVVHVRDVTQRREFQDQLAFTASHDPLTGLHSRASFLAQAAELVARAQPGSAVGVLYCDLDRFKHINDTLGHAAGDEVLKATAERLQNRLRTSDLIGRIGGDEFTIVLGHLHGQDVAERIAEKLRRAVEAPITLSTGQSVEVGVSIGVIVAEEPRDVDEVLNDADRNMYRVKSSHRVPS